MLVNVDDDAAPWRMYPPAFVIEPGAGAHSVADLVGGGHDFYGVLERYAD